MKATMNRRVFSASVATALASVCMPSFAQNKPWRIAFANLSDETPFGAAVAAGFKLAAKDVKDMQFTFLDNRFDAAKAVENARTVIAAKYDLFIEYNIQAAANKLISQLVTEAKLKTLAIQVPVGDAPLYAVDNFMSGTDSGKYIAETAKSRWGNEEPLHVIIGLPEAGPLFLERAEGARTAISKVYPNTKFTEFSSKNDAGSTRQLATDILTRNPGRKVTFWVHVDAMALAVFAAVRNQNRENDVLIATTGGDHAVFPEIRRPGTPFLGTYSFFPELWASDVIPLARRMLKGESVPARTSPRQQLFIHASNIDKYYPR